MNTIETIKPAVKEYLHNDQTEAAARERMQRYIQECQARAEATLQKIQTVVPTDVIVPARNLQFENRGGKLVASTERGRLAGKDPQGFHRNGLQQLASRLEIPMAYVDLLAGAQEQVVDVEADGTVIPAAHVPAHLPKVNRWGLDFLAKTLNELTAHSADKYLIRSVDHEARAVLSDKYRRIDCRPSTLMLLKAAFDAKFIVSDGTFTETRSSLKFIKPEVVEVFPGEFMVFGFEWSNSDYGRGASDLRLFFWRTWCWNGATGESVVRQIHIGRRLQEDVNYAQETLDADAHASALALRDAAAMAMSPAKLTRMIEGIQAANAQKIEPKNRVETLRKQGLTKAESEQVLEAFTSADVENMPAGNSLWRWSNAISWVGGHTEDADRRLDFERLAGEVLKPAMPAAQAAA